MSSGINEKEFNPQYPVPLVEQITEFLTSAIIEGRLKGGQRLVENEPPHRRIYQRAVHPHPDVRV